MPIQIVVVKKSLETNRDNILDYTVSNSHDCCWRYFHGETHGTSNTVAGITELQQLCYGRHPRTCSLSTINFLTFTNFSSRSPSSSVMEGGSCFLPPPARPPYTSRRHPHRTGGLTLASRQTAATVDLETIKTSECIIRVRCIRFFRPLTLGPTKSAGSSLYNRQEAQSGSVRHALYVASLIARSSPCFSVAHLSNEGKSTHNTQKVVCESLFLFFFPVFASVKTCRSAVKVKTPSSCFVHHRNVYGQRKNQRQAKQEKKKMR